MQLTVIISRYSRGGLQDLGARSVTPLTLSVTETCKIANYVVTVTQLVDVPSARDFYVNPFRPGYLRV